MPYFSTRRKPGVVFRVPAITPVYPALRAIDTSLELLVATPEHRARENAAYRTLDSCDSVLATAQINIIPLLSVPFDRAAALRKDLVEEGAASNDTTRFAPEGSDARTVTNDEAGVIEGGCVFSEPCSHRSFPRWWEEVCEVSFGLSHC
ncbi:unnamed protein product [Fusarium venenatum]|uniref:Uncharacterized protein n=1 Tax=Fusarium venenatum TaxID=56646 RepID=A0A2L2SSU2_9HYPO|nr:uncharacterized protein FVRRES_13181 [Fusarium venenatum]CEI40586.1 unnamed protein product [Fusarium venenatum]